MNHPGTPAHTDFLKNKVSHLGQVYLTSLSLSVEQEGITILI